MKQILYLISITLMVACEPKECKDFHLPHDFEIPIQVTPSKNQFAVGDTIKVYVNFDSREVYDVNFKKSFDISNFEIFPFSWFPQIDTFPVISGFVNNSVLVTDDFNPRFVEHSTITTTLNLSFYKECQSLSLEYQLILNHPGIYCLLNCPYLHQAPKFSGQCNSNHSQVHFKKADQFPERRDLLEFCQDTYLRQELNNDFEACAGFCFVVE